MAPQNKLVKEAKKQAEAKSAQLQQPKANAHLKHNTVAPAKENNARAAWADMFGPSKPSNAARKLPQIIEALPMTKQGRVAKRRRPSDFDEPKEAKAAKVPKTTRAPRAPRASNPKPKRAPKSAMTAPVSEPKAAPSTPAPIPSHVPVLAPQASLSMPILFGEDACLPKTTLAPVATKRAPKIAKTAPVSEPKAANTSSPPAPIPTPAPAQQAPLSMPILFGDGGAWVGDDALNAIQNPEPPKASEQARPLPVEKPTPFAPISQNVPLAKPDSKAPTNLPLAKPAAPVRRPKPPSSFNRQMPLKPTERSAPKLSSAPAVVPRPQPLKASEEPFDFRKLLQLPHPSHSSVMQPQPRPANNLPSFNQAFSARPVQPTVAIPPNAVVAAPNLGMPPSRSNSKFSPVFIPNRSSGKVNFIGHMYVGRDSRATRPERRSSGEPWYSALDRQFGPPTFMV